jgi:hypothetical protein
MTSKKNERRTQTYRAAANDLEWIMAIHGWTRANLTEKLGIPGVRNRAINYLDGWSSPPRAERLQIQRVTGIHPDRWDMPGTPLRSYTRRPRVNQPRRNVTASPSYLAPAAPMPMTEIQRWRSTWNVIQILEYAERVKAKLKPPPPTCPTCRQVLPAKVG